MLNYKCDKLGWPIEMTKGRTVQNLLRLILQNLRKLKK